jgi:hypothetical protein
MVCPQPGVGDATTARQRSQRHGASPVFAHLHRRILSFVNTLDMALRVSDTGSTRASSHRTWKLSQLVDGLRRVGILREGNTAKGGVMTAP